MELTTLEPLPRELLSGVGGTKAGEFRYTSSWFVIRAGNLSALERE